MSAIALSASAVLIAALSSHAFHSWLRQRERERLSTVDRMKLEAKFEELEEWKRSVSQFMANARLR